MKKCSRCQQLKALSAFSRNRTKADGLHTECKDCAKICQKQRKKRSPDYFRYKKWASEYGLTADQYAEMEAKQNGRCAICHELPSGRLQKLCVDHDHRTGKVRGLLCDKCNRAVGFFQDSPENMRAGALYVEGINV